MDSIEGSNPFGICVDDVARQLAAIFGGSRFRGSPALRRILLLLVEETLLGSGGRLDATVVARRALGKGAEFRSRRDSSVRVAMHRLRTALELYYAGEGAADDIVIGLPPGSYSPTFTVRTPGSPFDPVSDAIQLAEAYQEVLSPSMNARVIRVLRPLLASRPDDPVLLAIYGDVCLDSHKFGFDTVRNAIGEAHRAIEGALAVAPESPVVRVQCGMLALADEDLAHAKTIGLGLMHDRADPVSEAIGRFLVAQAMGGASPGDLPGPDALPEVTVFSWVHLTRFLDAYLAGDYEGALAAATDIALPHFFWGPVLRAVALAQLGLKMASRRQFSRGIALNPKFASNPRWHLAHHIKNEDALGMVLEGAKKAGL